MVWVSVHTTFIAVTKPSKATRRRSNKLTYKVTSVAPLPADLVETVSAAHAKVLLFASRHPETAVRPLLKNPDLVE